MLHVAFVLTISPRMLCAWLMWHLCWQYPQGCCVHGFHRFPFPVPSQTHAIPMCGFTRGCWSVWFLRGSSVCTAVHNFNLWRTHFTALGHRSINTNWSALPIAADAAKESLHRSPCHERFLRAPAAGPLWRHSGPAAVLTAPHNFYKPIHCGARWRNPCGCSTRFPRWCKCPFKVGRLSANSISRFIS